MPKPNELPRWGSAQTNETSPPGGVKDSGHELSSPIVSSYENWRARLTHDWIEWFESISGTLTTKLSLTSGRFRDSATHFDLPGEWTGEANPILAASTHQLMIDVPAQVGRRLSDIRSRVAPASVGETLRLEVFVDGVSVGFSECSGATLQNLEVNDLGIAVAETTKIVVVFSMSAFSVGAEILSARYAHNNEVVS